jgi:hypothetical protein
MNRLDAYESRVELTGQDSSRDRRHVPDLLVVTVGSGVTVVDVKAMSSLSRPCMRDSVARTRV